MPSQSPQPSFIPRETPSEGRAVRGEARGLADLLVLGAIVLFVASGALAVGVFLYDQYLGSSASSKLEQLERAKAAFEPSLIHELTRLNDRMSSAGSILGAHLAPSAFFRMLEETTIVNVGFTSLLLAPADNQHIAITMVGLAQSVNSIALQADLFAKGGVLTSPIFSNINRQSDGVHFNLTALLNPASINYAQLVAALGAGAPPAMDPSPFDVSTDEITPAPTQVPATGSPEAAPTPIPPTPPTPPASGGVDQSGTSVD